MITIPCHLKTLWGAYTVGMALNLANAHIILTMIATSVTVFVSIYTLVKTNRDGKKKIKTKTKIKTKKSK